MFAVDKLESFEGFDTFEPLFFVFADIVCEVVLFKQFDVFFFEAVVSFGKFTGDDIADTQTVTSGFIHVGRADTFEG